jgi:hypothetical protein
MFQRMFKDEPDNWQEVTEQDVREHLDGFYHSVDLAIEVMQQGIPHDTFFFIYRWIPDGDKSS